MSNDDGIIRVFKLWAKISMMIVDGTRDATVVADALQVILDTPTRSWRKVDGVTYFSVTSDGTTGEDWIKRLGDIVGNHDKQVLLSSDFKPTRDVTTKVAVLEGRLFSDINRTTGKIRAEAYKRKLTKPNAELACLIREKFSDEEIEAMGLWQIIAMHEPIKDLDGTPHLLSAVRRGNGRWLQACGDGPGYGWSREDGFAFAVSQVGPQN
jgi:hypothetical protein